MCRRVEQVDAHAGDDRHRSRTDVDLVVETARSPCRERSIGFGTELRSEVGVERNAVHVGEKRFTPRASTHVLDDAHHVAQQRAHVPFPTRGGRGELVGADPADDVRRVVEGLRQSVEQFHHSSVRGDLAPVESM